MNHWRTFSSPVRGTSFRLNGSYIVSIGQIFVLNYKDKIFLFIFAPANRNGEVLEWLKRRVWKARDLPKGFAGSNPALSAQQWPPLRGSLYFLYDMKILVTGAAGFIGSNLVRKLLATESDAIITGLDNLNDYYDVSLKEWRLSQLDDPRFTFVKGDIADKDLVDSLFERERYDIVVNLAAQAGVRYSITNPDAYIQSNLVGFYNILEACRHYPVQHLVYASSSSVYGSNKKVPYSTDDKVDNPVSLYAATKKSNELLAHAYSKLYNIPCTGLRFFTVYGPAGRPDMAYFGFTDKLIKGETIKIFNYGNCLRDFTYVDDIVEGVQRVMHKAPAKRNGEDGLPIPPYAIYNIGNSSPENLLDFVQILQEELVAAGVLPSDYDFEAHKELVPMQPGDVPVTFADTSDLERDFGFKPHTSLREGLRRFAVWYKEFYG